MANLRQSLGEVEQDNLISGTTMPLVKEKIVIPAGNVFKRGTLVTANGIMSTSGADAYGVLCDNIDATDGDVKAIIYVTGEFNPRALTATGNIEDYKNDLRKIGIFLKETVIFH